MMKIGKALSISLIGTALLIAAPALADPATPDSTQAQAGKPASQVDSVSTGSIDVEPSFDQRMADCMAIWDKGTHMSKDEWRRTCKTTLSGP